MILSHFKTDRMFYEFDYAQLEIRVLALATGDHQLIEDIGSGMDMHNHFAKRIFRKSDISPQERRLAKGFSFQLQYGAGAKGIAKHWNVDEELASTFIKEYFSRYPSVLSWQKQMLECGNVTLKHRGDEVNFESVPSYYIPSIWKHPITSKAISYFRLVAEKPPWADDYRISPTKCKNYPIQGAASDIMMFALNRLNRALIGTSATICNTVHDSVLLEVTDQAEEVIHRTKRALEGVGEEIEKLFEISVPIPFPVDYASGRTLEEVKKSS